jgi:hypothetical protein
MKQPVSMLNTVLVVNGVEITGYADGDDSISLKRLVDSATHKIGSQGDMMVSLSADRSGECGVKLQKVSSSNAFFLGLLRTQELAGGAAFVPIYLTALDVLRQDKGVGSGGYLKKVPDLMFGEHAGNQEWVIVVENLDLTFGADTIVTLA